MINCQNKNSITHFARHPEKGKRYDVETLFIDGVSDKEHFYKKKSCRKCVAKAAPRPLYNFGK